ncbi:hypothetical protein [Thalassotalea agarivorans]|uniref:Phage shock protein B n=1 Tax=Thalassotalea agarivorans TaxID=349064 RepID=A0A1I0GHM1_THASX|nr:hypothetical protein [Thalassotalea agarivorans]SET70645.1 hypothetical protein SAMN05660429_02446 [Thalassotalea agarivorans]
MNLWIFLCTAVVFGVPLAFFAIYAGHKRKMKQIELSMLQAQEQLAEKSLEQVNQQFSQLSKRIEVLEAIVTDKQYDLSSKIDEL